MAIDIKKFTSGVPAIIILIVFLYPPVIWNFYNINLMIRIMQISLGILISFIYISDFLKDYKKNRIKPSIIIIALVVYYLYLGTVTFINNGRFINTMALGMQFVFFCMYLDLVIRHNLNTIYTTCFNILQSYLIINLISVIIMPNGLYMTEYFSNNYFLGYDNQNINFILPTMMLALLRHLKYKENKKQTIIIMIISMLTAVIIWSSMTIIMVFGFCLFSAMIIFDKNKFLQKIFNSKLMNYFVLLGTNMALCIGIVFFNIQKYFSFIIEFVLRKSTNLSNRTYIWEKTIYYIKERFIFGHGTEEYNIKAVKMGFGESSPAGLHSHNRFLEVTYTGGIILLAIYLFMLIYIGFKLNKHKNKVVTKVLAFGLFIYLFGMITEFYAYSIFLWGFIIMAERIKYFVQNDENMVTKVNECSNS